jgi:hypothetical protein
MNKKPSKPSLIFITTFVNKYKIKLLIDTGATTTFINEKVLRHMTHPQYIHNNPYSFTLADGIAPFHVLGVVQLSIQFSNSTTTIPAHIASQLCTDMIIGMDYINKYNLNINIIRQTLSIQNNNHTFTMNIDKGCGLSRIPVTTSQSILIPAYSKRSTHVSTPISSICSSFFPTSQLHYQTPLSTTYYFLKFHNYGSSITLFNNSSSPRVLHKGICIGFLLYGSTSHPSSLSPLSLSNSFEVTDSPGMTSALFNFSAPQPEDDKSFGVTGNPGLRPVLNDLCIGRSPVPASPISNTFSLREVSELNRHNTRSFCNTVQLINPIVQEHMQNLVNNIANKQHQETILSLLLRYHRIFDITAHNIAHTPIHHVINTVPHSPPACRPYPQPDKEEAMYKLIQEFLGAFSLFI